MRPLVAALAVAVSDRSKALDLALTQIERQFGKGAIMRLGDPAASTPVDVIPTGAISLDMALGIGGVPRGRIIEIYGPESSGKTTLAQCVVAQAQRLGGVAAYIDAEHALDRSYAERCGINVQEMLISQPDTGEQALEICDMLVRSGGVDVIVIDSVAALVPRAEIEGDMGDSHVGVQARLMSQALRKLTGAISRSRAVVIFINQLRDKIGVMYGSPETTTGGKALKFYASIRLDIRKVETLKQGNDLVGMRAKVKVVKNKVAPPFRVAEFDIMFNEDGVISRSGALIDAGLEQGHVKKSGAWFQYEEHRLGQGRENAKQFLREHPEIAEELEDRIRQHNRPTAATASAADEDGEPEL